MCRGYGIKSLTSPLLHSGDAIHTGALNFFMRDFDFSVDALDVALRRLLMVVSLPKETQQIDRVMEAFANRYDQCHPGLLKESGKSECCPTWESRACADHSSLQTTPTSSPFH